MTHENGSPSLKKNKGRMDKVFRPAFVFFPIPATVSPRSTSPSPAGRHRRATYARTRGSTPALSSSDGLGLVTAGGDGLLRWDLDHESWKRKACEIAGRNLTQAEWREYLTFSSERGTSWLRHFDPPYRAACP
jgi:hypothetical protein